MVWKSDRWQAKLDANAGSDDSETEDDPAKLPQALEISYSRSVENDVVHHEEVVYEDPGENQAPRLLVSLKAVTALKDLCEHEHAKYDKTLKTLQECRSAYYKELRWLREQLHLAYRTDQEVIDMKSQYRREDFEVYWFEPPNYIDCETQEFLKVCIRETHRKLIDENCELKNQLAQMDVLQSGEVRPVLRQLRKENSAAKILRELHEILRTNDDTRDFEDAALQLLHSRTGGGPHRDSKAAVESGTDARAIASLKEELQEMRSKQQEDQAALVELRARLADGLDVELERHRADAERDRADAERQRADSVQQRADRLERQYNELRAELQRESFDIDRTLRLQKSLLKLGEAMSSLTPTSSCSGTPIVSPLARLRGQQVCCGMGSPMKRNVTPSAARHLVALGSSPGGSIVEAPLGTFDEALVRLDEVASGFEGVAHGIMAEIQQLRARVAQAEAAAVPKESEEELIASHSPKRRLVSSDVAIHEAAEIREEAAAAVEKTATATAIAAQREAEQLKSELERERSSKKELQAKMDEQRQQLDETQEAVVKLQGQVGRLRSRAEKLKKKINDLRAGRKVSPDVSDEEDDLDFCIDFLTPYRKRVTLAAANKERWELLSEDAAFARKKREYLVARKSRVYKEAGATEGEEAAVVNAAFQFLSGHAAKAYVAPRTVGGDHIERKRQAARGASPPFSSGHEGAASRFTTDAANFRLRIAATNLVPTATTNVAVPAFQGRGGDHECLAQHCGDAAIISAHAGPRVATTVCAEHRPPRGDILAEVVAIAAGKDPACVPAPPQQAMSATTTVGCAGECAASPFNVAAPTAAVSTESHSANLPPTPERPFRRSAASTPCLQSSAAAMATPQCVGPDTSLVAAVAALAHPLLSSMNAGGMPACNSNTSCAAEKAHGGTWRRLPGQVLRTAAQHTVSCNTVPARHSAATIYSFASAPPSKPAENAGRPRPASVPAGATAVDAVAGGSTSCAAPVAAAVAGGNICGGSPGPQRRAVHLGLQRRSAVPLTNAPWQQHRQQSKSTSDLRALWNAKAEGSFGNAISTDMLPAFPTRRDKAATAVLLCPQRGGG